MPLSQKPSRSWVESTGLKRGSLSFCERGTLPPIQHTAPGRLLPLNALLGVLFHRPGADCWLEGWDTLSRRLKEPRMDPEDSIQLRDGLRERVSQPSLTYCPPRALCFASIRRCSRKPLPYGVGWPLKLSIRAGPLEHSQRPPVFQVQPR